jgi:hypothetical protein
MKMSQAYAWLAAGVLAAGLNASYHDGGLQRVHEMVDQVEHSSTAVLTLARLQTRLLQSELAKAGFANTEFGETGFAKAELAKTQTGFDRLQAIDDREQARVDRMEARRARIEARITCIRIPAAGFAPMVFSAPRISECPRMRVDVPRLPAIQVPKIPAIHVEIPSAGPV